MAGITHPDLRQLSSSRWLIPILAAMAGEHGSRFGALAARLSISRPILSRNLALLEEFGWIVRKAGHGHPLRPEYVLSAPGQPIARWCAETLEQRRQLGLERHDLGRWSLPVIRELRPAPLGFTALQANLAPVSPRALSLTLKQMSGIDLVRQLPLARPLYELTDKGVELSRFI